MPSRPAAHLDDGSIVASDVERRVDLIGKEAHQAESERLLTFEAERRPQPLTVVMNAQRARVGR
jgi:hypothetical protein